VLVTVNNHSQEDGLDCWDWGGGVGLELSILPPPQFPHHTHPNWLVLLTGFRGQRSALLHPPHIPPPPLFLYPHATHLWLGFLTVQLSTPLLMSSPPPHTHTPGWGS